MLTSPFVIRICFAGIFGTNAMHRNPQKTPEQVAQAFHSLPELSHVAAAGRQVVAEKGNLRRKLVAAVTRFEATLVHAAQVRFRIKELARVA